MSTPCWNPNQKSSTILEIPCRQRCPERSVCLRFSTASSEMSKAPLGLSKGLSTAWACACWCTFLIDESFKISSTLSHSLLQQMWSTQNTNRGHPNSNSLNIGYKSLEPRLSIYLFWAFFNSYFFLVIATSENIWYLLLSCSHLSLESIRLILLISQVFLSFS